MIYLESSKATLKLVELLQPAVLDTCNIENFQIVLESWTIAHVQYIKILALLQGFLVMFLYLVWFPLRLSPFCELGDNVVMKTLLFCLEILKVMSEH